MMKPSEVREAVMHAVVPISATEKLDIRASAGRVCAVSLSASQALPRFDHSAVDGYAIRTAGLAVGGKRFKIGGSVVAGDPPPQGTLPDTAVRITTGAPIPSAADAVVMWECCRIEQDELVLDGNVRAGANIRRHGEDIACSAPIVAAGAVIDPRHVAVLAAMGVESIEVQRRLRVGLLSTGSELCVSGGQALKHQIHDANRPMLASLLASPRAEIVDGGIVDDDAQFIGEALRVLAAAADVVVGSGGAGDSDTDHAAAAIIAAGGSAETFEIAQRPGKRLVLGRIGELPVIWLPGTTVAAMVGCLLYVRPLLDVRAGRIGVPPAARRAVTNTLAGHRSGRTEFVPASIAAASGDGCLVVEPVASAGPASLGALLSAEGMMEIPADIVALGDARHEVLFHPFADAFNH